jgi:hypothetical protein
VAVVLAVTSANGRAGIVGGGTVAEVEFEWVETPQPRSAASTRDGSVPDLATSAGARFEEFSSGIRFDHSSVSTVGSRASHGTFVASGSGAAFLGFNSTRAYADADDMDLGCAWWHSDGASGRRIAPIAVTGSAFREGSGLRVRFQVRGFEAEGSNAPRADVSITSGWFVSSALLLVEPPAVPSSRAADEPEDVAVDVSVDGGSRFSEAGFVHRFVSSLARRAR